MEILGDSSKFDGIKHSKDLSVSNVHIMKYIFVKLGLEGYMGEVGPKGYEGRAGSQVNEISKVFIKNP